MILRKVQGFVYSQSACTQYQIDRESFAIDVSALESFEVSRPLDLVMRMGMAGFRNWNGNENWNVLGIRPEAVWNPFGITLECGIF